MGNITRLLIANRGEIACRVAVTAHRLGIATVGVYTEPDRNALHTDTVDVAVAVASYLDIEAVVAAAHRTGADGVHPGYGFLAENAAFAEAVVAAGLTWVGPTPDQIRLLGDKIAAKRAAAAAGVPTTPIVTLDGDRVPSASELPPFPVLVKAAAGGGGRGMRVAAGHDELDAAIASARREAESAFGDGTVFVEPYIARGRHIEVQVFGDTHGNVVHLGERECSIQRRNQKIVEESPAPGITEPTRRALLAAGVALARHVGYVGAGTVEFMVGPAGEITFLEVNTRLQVEHPVTEAVTGTDLVEWQLRVASGEPLPLAQHEIELRGAAIEVRVVAEDPAAGWLPSAGTLSEFVVGGFAPGVRVDTGFRAGSTVAAEYDSLLAKAISHGPTRAGAAAGLARALRGARLAGVRTNLATLAAILDEPDFLAGDTPTTYLDEHPAVLAAPAIPDAAARAHLVAAVMAAEQAQRSRGPLAFAPSGWRNLRTRGQRRTLLRDGVAQHVEYTIGPDGVAVDLLVGPPPEPGPDGALPVDARERVAVRLLDRSPRRQVVEIDGVRHAVDIAVDAQGDTITSTTAGTLVWTAAPRFAEHDLAAEGAGPISPLPGTVIAVHVAPGQQVTAGELLMVVEAMKMEHRIVAAAGGIVDEVRFAAGDRVDQGELLVALSPAEGR